jgi:hypothetical protein
MLKGRPTPAQLLTVTFECTSTRQCVLPRSGFVLGWKAAAGPPGKTHFGPTALFPDGLTGSGAVAGPDNEGPLPDTGGPKAAIPFSARSVPACAQAQPST